MRDGCQIEPGSIVISGPCNCKRQDGNMKKLQTRDYVEWAQRIVPAHESLVLARASISQSLGSSHRASELAQIVDDAFLSLRSELDNVACSDPLAGQDSPKIFFPGRN